jgi:hypothetical protein
MRAPQLILPAKPLNAANRTPLSVTGFSFGTKRFSTLTADVIKTSEMEGEKLDGVQVRSLIARRASEWISQEIEAVDRNVEGGLEMMLDATPTVPID